MITLQRKRTYPEAIFKRRVTRQDLSAVPLLHGVTRPEFTLAAASCTRHLKEETQQCQQAGGCHLLDPATMRAAGLKETALPF